jgi:hypothetical protein
LQHDDRTLSQDVDTVMGLLAARKAAFKAENNQRRHALNSFWFIHQDATEATGRCYVQVFAICDAGPPSPELTGCYEFTAVKHDSVWRFSRWVLKVDKPAYEAGRPAGWRQYLGTIRQFVGQRRS